MKIAERHKNGAEIELTGSLRAILPILESWRANQEEKVENEGKRPQVGFVAREEG